MIGWLGRYGGFALIVAGWLLLTGLIPSAAGPADVVEGTRESAPPPGVAGALPVAPRLIAAPSRGVLGLFPQRAPTATAVPAPPAPTAVPIPLPAEPTAEPTPAPTPGPAPPPAPTPAPLPTDRLVIPRIGLDTKVVDVGIATTGEMETVPFAAGRLTFSAQAGDPGNAVIAGHNDIQGEVFRRLPELREGDEIILYRGPAAYHYTVVVRTIVREDGASQDQRYENARWMDPTYGPTCTLISCYPYRVDTHRIIVHAVLTAGP
jgi:sortase A